MKKKILVLISCILLIITIIVISITYAIFESKVEGSVTVKTATWEIKINNTDITTGTNKSFEIDKINLNGSNHTKNGKIAPRRIRKF